MPEERGVFYGLRENGGEDEYEGETIEKLGSNAHNYQ